MKTAIVYGATGHIGSYLIPALVQEGYQVTAVSRTEKQPYTKEDPAWAKTEHFSGTREDGIALLQKRKFDLICDLIPYTKEDAVNLVETMKKTGHEKARLLSIGSLWIYDQKYESPVKEDHPRTATDPYGVGKTEIEAYLRKEYEENGLAYTILHPGHICASGWDPIGPQGTRNREALRTVLRGETLLLPDRGQATLHHVHAQDIASLCIACIRQPVSIGESFHIAAPAALTLTGYAKGLFKHFNQPVNIAYLPYDAFMETLSSQDSATCAEHIDRSPCASMDKAWKLLGFVPAHSALDTVIEAIESIRSYL